jgi:alpha-ketoglutarate-dependent taurine dioxygenase
MDEHLHNLEQYGYFVLTDISRTKLDSIGRMLGSGSSLWHEIQARNRDDARRRSLSGIHGRDAFPWHSDGAIALEPPRYILMYCDSQHFDEPTEVLSLRHESMAQLVRSMARTVLLVENSRSELRYTTALKRLRSGMVARWDTRVCHPRASRPARETVAALAAAEPTGSITWAPGTGAVIDNFAALHRRPCVRSALRTLHRKYIFE